MQFIYIEESGIAKRAIGVMVGVIADSYGMRPTEESWNNLLDYLSKTIGKQIGGIHTRGFYSGNSPWRQLDGHQRSQIINAIFNWFGDRKHSIVYCAVHKTKFHDTFHTEPAAEDISTLWRFMALHLALSIQKCFQGPDLPPLVVPLSELEPRHNMLENCPTEGMQSSWNAVGGNLDLFLDILEKRSDTVLPGEL